MNVQDQVVPLLSDLSFFRTWLESKVDVRFVGLSRNACKCPVSEWLRETVGVRLQVGLYRVYESADDGERQVCSLPDWALRFITLVDGCGTNKPVTAYEALELLARALH